MTEKALRMAALYPVGTRIRMDCMGWDPQPIPDGMCGTVVYVDDAGTLHTRWDNGRSLGIIPEVDLFTVIGFTVIGKESYI